MAAPSAVEKTWPQKNEMQLISHNLETRMGFYARIFRGGKAQLLYCAGIEMGLIPTSGGRRNWSHLEPGIIMQQALPIPEY